LSTRTVGGALGVVALPAVVGQRDRKGRSWGRTSSVARAATGRELGGPRVVGARARVAGVLRRACEDEVARVVQEAGDVASVCGGVVCGLRHEPPSVLESGALRDGVHGVRIRIWIGAVESRGCAGGSTTGRWNGGPHPRSGGPSGGVTLSSRGTWRPGGRTSRPGGTHRRVLPAEVTRRCGDSDIELPSWTLGSVRRALPADGLTSYRCG
jgi:hypothetical protein